MWCFLAAREHRHTDIKAPSWRVGLRKSSQWKKKRKTRCVITLHTHYERKTLHSFRTSYIIVLQFYDINKCGKHKQPSCQGLYTTQIKTSFLLAHYPRWGDTWEPEEPDLRRGCDLTSDLSRPDFFSRVNNNCEGDLGSSSCRRPRTMIGANAEHTHAPAL